MFMNSDLRFPLCIASLDYVVEPQGANGAHLPNPKQITLRIGGSLTSWRYIRGYIDFHNGVYFTVRRQTVGNAITTP